MLSVSGGLRAADPKPLLARALEELLSVDGPTPEEVLGRIRKRLLELYKRDAFQSAVPHGIVVHLATSGEGLSFQFGPMGTALIARERVVLLHDDERIPALRVLGAKLERAFPKELLKNELLCAVTSLTELEPNGSASGTVAFNVPTGGAVVLMSRGAFPFNVPKQTTLEEWWSLDAGWRHGMEAMLVFVGDCPTLPLGVQQSIDRLS
jgi:hypothetical protein